MTADLSNFAKERVIIMSAPNGARRSQADHPALPRFDSAPARA
jgi:uncharacterized protein (DUF849 family)